MLLVQLTMTTRRLYYDDSFQREFDARVLSCEHEPPRPTPTWGVVLDSTAFYPTAGGQPNDLGRLDEAHVLDVRDDGDDILHIIDRELPLGAVGRLHDDSFGAGIDLLHRAFDGACDVLSGQGT